MNALERNAYTDAWRAFGAAASPRAILAVSAHWYVAGTRVTAMQTPRTIHDFGGFPPELFAMTYPAPGDPALAARVRQLLAPLDVALDQRWGLDHGTWSVLVHAFPDASVPVVQLSLDRTLTAPDHYAIARRLAPLRDEGVLVVGSGNVVHNLEVARASSPAGTGGWAARFEDDAWAHIARGDDAPLVRYGSLPDADLAAPTPEHYLPLLYVLAQRRAPDAARLLVRGIEWDAIAMLSFALE